MAILGSYDRDKYEQILREASASVSKDVIANRFPWQTRLAVRQLLEHAHRNTGEIRMVVGTGSDWFFDDALVKDLRETAAKGCKIRMLVWNDDPSGIADGLKTMAKESKLELRWPRRTGTHEAASRLPHFMVVGAAAYRLEAPGHGSFGPDTEFTETQPDIPARICFNDADSAAKQITLFDALWVWDLLVNENSDN